LSVSRSLSGSPVPEKPSATASRASTGNVLDTNRCRRHLLRSDEIGESIETVVRDCGHADVGLVRLGGVCRDLRARLRERVEQRRLARVWESYDADLERHGGEGYPASPFHPGRGEREEPSL